VRMTARPAVQMLLLAASSLDEWLNSWNTRRLARL